MNKIIIIAVECIAIAFIINLRDKSLSGRNSKSQDRLFTVILIIVLGLYCGLRTWYNDTVTYFQIYEQSPVLSNFIGSQDANFAHGIGFYFINSVMKTLNFSAQDYMMTYSFAMIIMYILFMRRFSCNLMLSLFLYFTNSWFVFSVAAIKQCMATGVCLIALMYAAERKWIKFFIAVAIASTFHPYALIYLLVPFMTFHTWTLKTYLAIGVFVIAGFLLQRMIGTIVDITVMMGADYDENEFIGEGVNIFRVIVCLVPTGLSFIYRNKLFRDSGRTDDIMMNLVMLNGLIMFVGIFGTANYFARLANYFLPMQVIALPWLLKKIGGSEGQMLTIGCVIGYSGFCVYENRILKVFDSGFAQMSLFKYISSHF